MLISLLFNLRRRMSTGNINSIIEDNVPLFLTDPQAFASIAHRFGLQVDHRFVFERKAAWFPTNPMPIKAVNGRSQTHLLYSKSSSDTFCVTFEFLSPCARSEIDIESTGLAGAFH